MYGVVVLTHSHRALACNDVDHFVDVIVHVLRDSLAHLQQPHGFHRLAREDGLLQRVPPMKFLSTKSGMDTVIGGPLGRADAAEGDSDTGLAGVAGGGGAGGAALKTTSTGFQAPLPTENSRSRVTNPSCSQRTRTTPAFGTGIIAVPAGPVVNSPLATPETTRRTSDKAEPSWSFTETLTEVGFAAAEGRGAGGVARGAEAAGVVCAGGLAGAAGGCATGLATAAANARAAKEPVMIVILPLCT